ncbi:hypothetical protein AXG53_19200 [Stenotrophomonas sp. KCTC 12332]|nr:hypothetical protein AXG53_19200 [Stenotrophomonas sp. KCTC 12332]
MVSTEHTITTSEFPNLVQILPLINDFKHVIGDSLSIHRAEHFDALIDQPNKNNHLKLRQTTGRVAQRGIGHRSFF